MPETHWFRIHDVATEGGASIYLQAFPVIKETPKGVWIEAHNWRGRRFVIRDARKRWACPTIDEARLSFHQRKRRQARILAAQHDYAKALADQGTTFEIDNLEGCLRHHGLSET